MDSTPPIHRSEPRLRTKSASRLSRIRRFVEGGETQAPIQNLSLDIVSCSPKIESPSPENHSPKRSYNLPVRELLLLSPSPHQRSKTRCTERLEVADDPLTAEAGVSRRRCKNRTTAAAVGVWGCASPRNGRRSSRRRMEHYIIREEKEIALVEEMAKPRRRRHSGHSKKEKLTLVPSIPIKTNDGDGSSLDQIGQVINDLVMWKDVAKSSLWFGFGSLCCLSSCFTGGITFSLFSLISQTGLLFLGLSFLSNSICQRDSVQKRAELKLREDDILKVARVILPPANFVISKTRELFSGEPSMTLKVAPFFLLGAEYGHLITLWRLCVIGFFLSFIGPKLYSCYSLQIYRKAEYLKRWVSEAWGACSHKKIVAASAVTAFWNMTSIRTRFFAAFIFLVVLRYNRQHSETEEVVAEKKGQEHEQLQALVVVESGSTQQ